MEEKAAGVERAGVGCPAQREPLEAEGRAAWEEAKGALEAWEVEEVAVARGWVVAGMGWEVAARV